jgi:WS/DGAT/MGAT family acyltransferase
MRLLSPVDQMFVRMETSRTPMHIGALAIFRLPAGAGPEFVRDIHAAFSELAYLPFPFDSVLSGGAVAEALPTWRRVEPDPEYHVRLDALPSPGDDADLGRLVERLHSHQLDMTRPLWEAHVIEGLSEGRFAFYFKAHHGAVDGMGAMSLITNWLSTEPGGPAGSGAAELDERRATLLDRLRVPAKRVGDGVLATGELAGRLLDMARGSNSSVRAALRTPRTPFNQKLTKHRRIAVQVLELPRLKAVATATGATVNDVVLTTLGGAVRSYLEDLDALPEESLTVSVPVGFDRDEGTLNAATGFVCPLGTDLADPLERLKQIGAGTSRGKADLSNMSANALQHYTLLGLVPLMIGQKTGLLRRLPPLFNFTVSNVVLSREPLYLLGAELDLIVPVSFLADGYGLNVTLVGYKDRVTLGFVACRDTVPHVQRLAVLTGEALSELEALVAPQA